MKNLHFSMAPLAHLAGQHEARQLLTVLLYIVGPHRLDLAAALLNPWLGSIYPTC
ncbi:MAG: hypothetical protein IPN76_34270 [Saprospiraceae bacterium]|nr:hypothetical protein [Saprospiraceae bacterium]